MDFFISDCHFCHSKIIKYSNRPFKSTQQMNDRMIEMWNNTVSKEDTVYYLGDFCWSFKNNIQKLTNITRSLNGKKILIKGNHDHFSNYEYLNAGFDSVYDICKKEFLINNEHYYIVMCHYAMKFWDRSHLGSLHLYGHQHFKRDIDFQSYAKLEMSTRCMNVCADGNNYKPYSLIEIVNLLKDNPTNFVF